MPSGVNRPAPCSVTRSISPCNALETVHVSVHAMLSMQFRYTLVYPCFFVIVRVGKRMLDFIFLVGRSDVDVVLSIIIASL